MTDDAPLPTVHNLAAGVRAFSSNVFLVPGEVTALVDVGANFDVAAAVRERVDGLDAVYLTHTHPDHVGAVDDVRNAFDVETRGFDTDLDAVDAPIADEETVRIGDLEYQAVHTPGHKPDHLCFHAADPGVLFAGDLVFANGGFGRTDLEGGDRETLIRSLERIRGLVGEDLQALYPGHGPAVTSSPADDVDLATRAARMG